MPLILLKILSNNQLPLRYYGAVYASNNTLIIIETTDLEELRKVDVNSLKVKI